MTGFFHGTNPSEYPNGWDEPANGCFWSDPCSCVDCVATEDAAGYLLDELEAHDTIAEQTGDDR